MMDGILHSRAVYPESDYSYALRKVQRFKWSMDT